MPFIDYFVLFPVLDFLHKHYKMKAIKDLFKVQNFTLHFVIVSIVHLALPNIISRIYSSHSNENHLHGYKWCKYVCMKISISMEFITSTTTMNISLAMRFYLYLLILFRWLDCWWEMVWQLPLWCLSTKLLFWLLLQILIGYY